MTVLLMVGPEPLGSALNHHSGRDPQGTSAPLQAHYGIYRTPTIAYLEAAWMAAGVPRRLAWILVNSAPSRKICAE